MLAWLAGIALQMQQAALWPVGAYAALCAGAGLLLLAVPAARRAPWVALPALAVLAFASTGWRAEGRLADRLDPALEGRDLIVSGVVAGLPTRTETGWRLRLEVQTGVDANGAAVRLPRLLSLAWRDVQVAPAPGQRWSLAVRLRRPHGLSNPHGFDLELWLFEQGLGATGYVRSPRVAPARRLDDGSALFGVEVWRQQVRDALYAQVRDPAVAGVIAALAVGDQAAIVRGDWDVFRATGTAHLMSISGLHLTMLAWLASALARRLWSRWPRAALWMPAPMAARWIGLAVAFVYALVAGFGVPAQRTLWMLACVTLLRSTARRWPWPVVLAAAALVVTLADPWALMQPGFWLSFVAVGLLMVSDAGEPRGAGAFALLRQGLQTQVVATVGLAPLSMVLFQQLSLVGFLANLVAVPLVTLVVTPLSLLGMLLPALWSMAAVLVGALGTLLAALAALPGAVLWVAAAPAWAQGAALLAGLLAVAPLPWRARLAALPLVLPLLSAGVLPLPAGRFELLAVDVGQGSAVLLRTRSHLLLYDAGPMYSPTSDAGQRVLLPLLRALGHARLDLLVLSHRDSDHVGGAAALLRGLEVRQLSSSLEPEHPLQRAGATRCVAGQSWQWDGVRFEMLHPPAGAEAAASRPNALSCVLRVAAARGSALLPGDIEAAQELALVATRREQLRADVLLVPHHGSRTSSTAAFLDAVAPRIALVQAGYRNRFGHPAAEVVSRHADRGITLLRSERCGAWRWRSGAATGVCWRQVALRYWHHPDAEAALSEPQDDEPFDE